MIGYALESQADFQDNLPPCSTRIDVPGMCFIRGEGSFRRDTVIRVQVPNVQFSAQGLGCATGFSLGVRIQG